MRKLCCFSRSCNYRANLRVSGGPICQRSSSRAHARRSLLLPVGGPQGQIVTQQLHDQCGILVGILRDVVQLSDGIFKGCASHLASLIWIGQDLVLEDREVQRQAQANGMGHSKTLLSHLGCLLVCLAGTLCSSGLTVSVSEFSNVAIVVSFHFLVEDLGLVLRSLGDQVLVEQTQDRIADLLQLSLDLAAVLSSPRSVLIISLCLLLLLHTRDDAPSCTATAHGVLVGHGQQIALLHGQLLASTADLLHVIRHLIIPLSLLGQLGEVHVLGPGHGDTKDATPYEGKGGKRQILQS